MRRDVAEVFLALALAAVTSASATAKAVSPPPPHALLTGLPYHALAIAEGALAVMLCTKWRRLAASVIVLMAMAGVALAYLWPYRACGCFGSIIALERDGHVMLASACGLSAITVIGFASGRAKCGAPGR